MEKSCSAFHVTNGYECNIREVLELLRMNGCRLSVHIPRPSPPVLLQILGSYNIRYRFYRNLFYGKGDVNLAGMLEDFLLCGMHSCVVVNSNGGYPSGLRINESGWRELLHVCKERDHLVWLNMTNVGLNDGNMADECRVIRQCRDEGIPCIVSMDLGSSFGLCGNGFGCVFSLKREMKALHSTTCQLILQHALAQLLQNDDMRQRLYSIQVIVMNREEERTRERNRLERIRALLIQRDKRMQFLQYGCGPYGVSPEKNGGYLNLSSTHFRPQSQVVVKESELLKS